MWADIVFSPTVLLSASRTETVGPTGQAVIVLFCLAIGGLIALVGLGYLQTYTRVRRMDPVPIQQLADSDSEVELTGTARAHETTSHAPFTDTECLASEWKLREYRGSGGKGSNWSTLDSGETRQTFRLEDETGAVLVDPGGATLELTTEQTVEVDPDESPPPAISEYLDETEGVSREHARKRKYVEQRLTPGEDIHVFGPVWGTGQADELPGDAAGIVGVRETDRGFTVGEDGLSEFVDQIKTDTTRFTITIGDEHEAERYLLKKGLLISGFGLVFALLPLIFVVVL